MIKTLFAGLVALCLWAAAPLAHAQAGNEWILGAWRINVSIGDQGYVGIANIFEVQEGRYEAHITLISASSGTSATELARVTVDGDAVIIDSYDVVQTNEPSGWDRDDFTLHRDGDRMFGSLRDEKGEVGDDAHFFR
ncbi:hypothetical protein [Terricaulis sp.]|uniref:hypothetical protein n=1 Tax=Terricaulis sp. TaxID=2768686 RepID=UPI003784EF82